MALTNDKLVSRLQTQLGLTKQESRQAVERLFEILKDTLPFVDSLRNELSVRSEELLSTINEFLHRSFTEI